MQQQQQALPQPLPERVDVQIFDRPRPEIGAGHLQRLPLELEKIERDNRRHDRRQARPGQGVDPRAAEKTDGLDPEKGGKLKSIADTCAAVLLEKTESAEVFTQLVRRAQMQKDYRRIDTLADALTSRFPPSEICELARSEDVVVRELANEALARCPVSVLTGLLGDPVDAETARAALRRQVVEYGSEEARQIVNAIDLAEEF